MVKIEREIPLRLTPGNNPFLTGLFAPVSREITADEPPVIGEIPKDLEGVYLRNGPNPTLEPRGRYHWFDGDGMVHAIAFHNGKATYRNRWLRTAGFAAEQEAGHAIWPGLMDRPDPSVPRAVDLTIG
jgi:carotenoid cleavage dioxygenase-like enzyme